MTAVPSVELDSRQLTRKPEHTARRGPVGAKIGAQSVNLSPGIPALYWLAAGFAAAALWRGACHLTQTIAAAGCPCCGDDQ